MNHLPFSSLEVSTEVKKAIAEMGFEEATPIQSLTIPLILEGRDIIGEAQTGTGKTCAFGIPAIEKADPEAAEIQTLVLCPTRELAVQISEELKTVAKHKRGLRILPIYGGQSIERQMLALKSQPQIVIGTPGRVMDHMRRGTLRLDTLRMLVLDEADEMLNMGFKEDIDTILESIPATRQMVLFSATMSRGILDLTRRYLKDAEHVRIEHKQLAIPLISQFVIETREYMKTDILARILDAENYKLCMVFCNTKRRVDEVTLHLQARGYMAAALHGDMSQQHRDRVMGQFRKNTIDILVATDVAARGIDVDDIEAVFNIDIPNDEEYYVHRIGRTGRAGKTGAAYSFITPPDYRKMKEIQHFTKAQLTLYKVPTIRDLEDAKSATLLQEAVKSIREGVPEKYMKLVETFLEEQPDSDAASAVASLTGAAGAEGLDANGSETNPLDDAGFEDETLAAVEEPVYYTALDLAAAFLKMSVEKSTASSKLVQIPAEPPAERRFGSNDFRDNGPRPGGGYRGRDDSRSGGGYRGRDDRSGGGYRGRDDRSGGGYRDNRGSYGGPRPEGGFRNGTDAAPAADGAFRGNSDAPRTEGAYRGHASYPPKPHGKPGSFGKRRKDGSHPRSGQD